MDQKGKLIPIKVEEKKEENKNLPKGSGVGSGSGYVNLSRRERHKLELEQKKNHHHIPEEKRIVNGKALVIIPAYNSEKTILDSINSVLTQTYKNLSIVVVDDFSEDKTFELVSSINDDRLNVIRNNENVGTYQSINRALFEYDNSFDYFTIHGSDDLMLEDKIEIQLRSFEDPNTLASSAGYRRINFENGQTITEFTYGESMVIYDKKVFEELGYYDNTRFGGDTEYIDRFLLTFGEKSINRNKAILSDCYVSNWNLTKKIGTEERRKYREAYKINHISLKDLYVGFELPKLDIMFLMPSYERFDECINRINEIRKQTSGLKYRVAVVNDNSQDPRYNQLKSFDDILYQKTNENNGKDGFYKTINLLMDASRLYDSKIYIFMADDLKISKKFIFYINDIFEKGYKIINYLINKEERYTNWGFNDWVDGGFAIKGEVYKKMNGDFPNTKILMSKNSYGSGVWRYFTINRINKENLKVFFPKHSLVYHEGHTESVMHKEIRKNEPIFSYSFIDHEDSLSIYRDEDLLEFSKKIQLKVSNSVKFFESKMKKKYNTKDYTDIYEPVVFFGMYLEEDYHLVINHKGPKAIVWCGTDALNIKRRKSWHLDIRNCINVSMSDFVKDSLSTCSINSTKIPITPTKLSINVKPKGKSIYWYYSREDRRDFYGGTIIDQIKTLRDYEIIEANSETFNEDQLQTIYEKCFLCLRLTDHDGLSNTVVEFGLMGKKCIHNNDLPNCIPYDKNDINDIIDKIDEEYKKIGESDQELANSVYKYLIKGSDLSSIFR